MHAARDKTTTYTTKEAKSVPIPLRNGPSQVPGPPSNFKKPLKKGTSSLTSTKFGILKEDQINSFKPT